MSHAFTESPERLDLRKAVAAMAANFGEQYFYQAAISGRKTTELWQEAGKHGYLGVAIPEAYGGGGGEIGDLAAVCEELATAGCPLLMMVVSPRRKSIAGCRDSPTERPPTPSRSPRPTPARTRTTSPPWRPAAKTAGFSTGRKRSFRASTKPATCW